MSAENPKYWGMEGDEKLTCTSIEDRMEEFDNYWFSEDPMPETVELIGYDPMVITEAETTRYADWILDQLLVNLDESEYNAAEDYTESSQAMKDAAAEFIKKIVSEYKVWSCVEVCRKTVNVADYIDLDAAP